MHLSIRPTSALAQGFVLSRLIRSAATRLAMPLLLGALATSSGCFLTTDDRSSDGCSETQVKVDFDRVGALGRSMEDVLGEPLTFSGELSWRGEHAEWFEHEFEGTTQFQLTLEHEDLQTFELSNANGHCGQVGLRTGASMRLETADTSIDIEELAAVDALPKNSLFVTASLASLMDWGGVELGNDVGVGLALEFESGKLRGQLIGWKEKGTSSSYEVQFVNLAQLEGKPGEWEPPVNLTDAGVGLDSGVSEADGGVSVSADSGAGDAGQSDAGQIDASGEDAGEPESGPVDAGQEADSRELDADAATDAGD